jgi:hypothetical protein
MADRAHAEKAGGARPTLVLALVLGVAAAAFDAAPLYVPAVGLALLVAGLGAWVRLAAHGARVEARRGERTAVEGHPYPLRLELRRRALPWPGARLEHPLLGSPLPLPARARGLVEVELRFPRRGRRRLEAPRLEVSDPLGLHQAEAGGGGAGEVLVLPRTEPVRAEAAPGGLPVELLGSFERGLGGGGLDTASTDFEVDGLRPYRPGSPATRIHWPTLARRGDLMEHRLVSGGFSPPLVVLDGAEAPDEPSLDAAVRAAASLCRHLADIGGCLLAVPGAPRLLRIDRRLGGWPDAHARLALAGPSTPRAARRLAQGARSLFWVSASGRPPALSRGRGRSAFLVSPKPAPEGTAPVEFTVAGCRGLRIAAGSARRTRAAA